MKIRIYYDGHYGTVRSLVIEGSGQWNLLELNPNDCKGDGEIEFELTEENLEKYMDNPHEVDLEAVELYLLEKSE